MLATERAARCVIDHHEIDGKAVRAQYISAGKRVRATICWRHWLAYQQNVTVLGWEAIEVVRPHCAICGNDARRGETFCRSCAPKVAAGRICRRCGFVIRAAPYSLCDDCVQIERDGGRIKIVNPIAEAGYWVTVAPMVQPRRGQSAL